jgi:hypothetical protein
MNRGGSAAPAGQALVSSLATKYVTLALFG